MSSVDTTFPTLLEWAAALRSGEYVQGRKALKTADGKFCCLGVYADLCVKRGIGQWVGGRFKFAPDPDCSVGFSLPASQDRAWKDAPVRSSGEGFVPGGGLTLATINDNFWRSRDGARQPPADFNTIADLIEAKAAALETESVS